MTSKQRSMSPNTMESNMAWQLCHKAFRGDIAGLKQFLDQGQSLDVHDYDGRTPLHLAASAGQFATVKFLVEEAKCTLQRDRFGGLPIHDAERSGHDELKEYLQNLDFEAKLVNWQGDVNVAKQALMDKVLSLVLKQGVWVFGLAYSEMEYYFNELGLDDWYFKHYTPAQIAKHIHCYIASKKVGQTTGDYTIQFHMEAPQTAFFLTSIGVNKKPLQQTEELVTKWMNAVPDNMAYSLTYVESNGAAYRGRKDRLAIFVVESNPFQGHEVDEDEDSLELLATTNFLKEKQPKHQISYQQLLHQVAKSSTDSWAGVIPTSPLGVTAWGQWLVQFGIRQRQPVYLQQFQQALDRLGVQSRKKHIETFQNGITCYHFYCNSLPGEKADDCLRALQLVPHMKQSPLTHLFLDNKICSDSLIYFSCVVKFAFHFVKKDTREYLILAQALQHDPANKEKLDHLYLQAIMDLLTEDRVYDVVLRYPDFCRQLYADFRQIALGQRERFFNETLAKQLAMNRDETDVKVLSAMLTFNQHLTGTNFFRCGGTPSSLAFRLDPSFLKLVSQAIFPEVPHTVYLVVGRSFYGFHIRFRDVARGGIRVIKSRDESMYRRNAGTLFEECYNLAITQQRKNKDIPEGGAKGTILLNPDAQAKTKEAFTHYVDALLDCMLPDRAGIHCPNPDILFFGPDENTADLMEVGASHARSRGYPLWKSLTTGKPPSQGGIPHDVYGMTTLGVHTFKLGLLQMLGKREEEMTKVQTGGPDGDLGSNEIKISKDRTIAVVDGSGVAYDPVGLDRAELLSLAERRIPIGNFDPSKLKAGGFLVRVGDSNVTLPDGTVVQRGDLFRDSFHLSVYATADLFVPCGGRPKAVTGDNVHQMLVNGQPKFKCIVEGANLFFTDSARKVLEDAGAHVLKDASTNKGGVTSSSLEVLAALVMPDEDHQALMCVPSGGRVPDFYLEYVKHIQQIIAEKARMEFSCLWAEKQRDPKSYYCGTTERLSTKINGLGDMIGAEVVDDADIDLIRTVLKRCIPALLIDRYGVDFIMKKLPTNYMHATVAAWLAATYVYECGFGATEYAFHKFLGKLQNDGMVHGVSSVTLDFASQ
eukprot:GGOE01065557.1.p1 GENE.GGOE01065557.1~~GGOE01065557.1.p1  ORF type:complete len:1121 (+),score=347.12 GGOE01065557.1:70-3363(+)